MYLIMKNNTVMEWANYRFKPEAIEVEIDYDDFCQNPSKYEVIDGVLTDISESATYSSLSNEIKRAEIISQIEQIESKQHRALREMVLSPNETAKEKLDEIEAQIIALRQQM